jgi:hypothetical protein
MPKKLTKQSPCIVRIHIETSKQHNNGENGSLHQNNGSGIPHRKTSQRLIKQSQETVENLHFLWITFCPYPKAILWSRPEFQMNIAGRKRWMQDAIGNAQNRVNLSRSVSDFGRILEIGVG